MAEPAESAVSAESAGPEATDGSDSAPSSRSGGSVWAIVVAAGSGSRFGGLKQFGMIQGQTVLARAVSSLVPVLDGAVIVLPDDVLDGSVDSGTVLRHCGVDPSELARPVPFAVTAGAGTRAGSVRAGLALVPVDCEVVLVHDAARPLASRRLAESVVAAVRAGADGAVPALPLSDTVKRVDGEIVLETIERERLVRAQTPQGFRTEVLRRAHAADGDATDDAGLVERAGGRVVVVAGEEHNFKLTAPEDLALAEWWAGRVAEQEAIR